MSDNPLCIGEYLYAGISGHIDFVYDQFKRDALSKADAIRSVSSLTDAIDWYDKHIVLSGDYLHEQMTALEKTIR